MSEAQTLLLGFIAGVTIVLGLPVGRMRSPRPGLRQFLNALAAGILLFIVWDVLAHAYVPLDSALSDLHGGTGGLGDRKSTRLNSSHWHVSRMPSSA